MTCMHTTAAAAKRMLVFQITDDAVDRKGFQEELYICTQFYSLYCSNGESLFSISVTALRT